MDKEQYVEAAFNRIAERCKGIDSPISNVMEAAIRVELRTMFEIITTANVFEFLVLHKIQSIKMDLNDPRKITKIENHLGEATWYHKQENWEQLSC